jgi:hypothetical protein
VDLESAATAIEFFRQRQLHGVVSLLEFLLSPEGANVIKIGSTTIGFQDLDLSKFTTEEERMMVVMGLPSMHFGTTNGGHTALEELVAMATEKFDQVPKINALRFDTLCSDLQLLATGSQGFKLIGSGMIFGKGGQGTVQ